MYTPKSFQQGDRTAIFNLMERVGFATLITETEQGMVATHAPILAHQSEESFVLRGHIARANPQWQTSRKDREGLAIFIGPNGYVSPQWYASKAEHGRVVPTWNYVAVHAYGEVRFSEDPALLLSIVVRLTEIHEARSAQPWKVSDAPKEYIDGLLKAIVAFEMKVTAVEASWKLSQNKTQADRDGVMQGFAQRGEAVAEEMKNLYCPDDLTKS